MPKEVKLPQLGEEVDNAEITNILVEADDEIEEEQSIIEVETGKAAAEVPSPAAGKVKEIKVEVGQQVAPGDVILTLAGEGEETAEEPEETEEEETEEQPSENEKSEKEEPEDEGEEDEEQESEDKSEEEEEEEQEKPEDEGEEPEKEEPEKKEPEKEEAEEEQESGSGKTMKTEEKKRSPASPSVRRFAREMGVDVDKVEGSGPAGRVSKQDVKNHVHDRNTDGETSRVSAAPDDGERRQALSNVRKAIARKMSESANTIPLVTHHDDADISNLDLERMRLKKDAEEQGVKLTLTAILMKILATALRRFPRFNSSIDMENEEIVLKDSVHIGVAVDTDRGLLVPVIRNVHRKGVFTIAKEMQELGKAARDGKIKTEQLQGATCSLSNIGSIGGVYFTPIVPLPQVAVLGIGKARHQLTPTGQPLMLPLSLSYDHRAVDGADAARFLQWLVTAIEHPVFLLTVDDEQGESQ